MHSATPPSGIPSSLHDVSLNKILKKNPKPYFAALAIFFTRPKWPCGHEGHALILEEELPVSQHCMIRGWRGEVRPMMTECWQVSKAMMENGLLAWPTYLVALLINKTTAIHHPWWWMAKWLSCFQHWGLSPSEFRLLWRLRVGAREKWAIFGHFLDFNF